MTSKADHRLTIAHFKCVLERAAEERELRPELVPGPDGPECQWVAYERTKMLMAVNASRSERGLKEVTEKAVIKVERLAVGHSDYTLKYAIGCADLVAEE
ncbi:hypothetical protein [Streptomyces sp. NPDC088727]|uniref:hypothetical protein n=1 Tax=Streptomyces sp. NPDC088727 TaxID=3365875 RepID=UPI0037F514CE